MCEAVLRQLLIEDVVIADRCGTRIYPHRAPEGTDRPYAVYHRVSATDEPTQASGGTLISALVQFDWIADSFEKARELGVRAKYVLNAWHGMRNGLSIQRVFWRNGFDDVDLQIVGSEKRIPRHVQEYEVFYDEVT